MRSLNLEAMMDEDVVDDEDSKRQTSKRQVIGINVNEVQDAETSRCGGR